MSVNLTELTEHIFEQMPPSTRFRPEDAAVIKKHHDILLTWGEDLVQGFYNTLFEHPPTAGVFVEGERPQREESLRQWWKRTLAGPFDQEYWEWQAYVGLIHYIRRITNPMMIAMWDWVLVQVEEHATAELPPEEVAKVVRAFSRLSSSVTALISESYIEHYLEAVGDASGIERALLDRLARTEIESMKKRANY